MTDTYTAFELSLKTLLGSSVFYVFIEVLFLPQIHVSVLGLLGMPSSVFIIYQILLRRI